MVVKNKFLLLLWLIVPPIYGFIYFYLAWTFYDSNNKTIELLFHPLITQILFSVFWFWVGMRFTRFSHNSITSYVIGNSLWLASILIFLWHYVILKSETNNWLSTLSQAYSIPFMWSGYELEDLLKSVFSFNDADFVISFIVMIFVFTIGFITGKVRVKSKINV